ncbi:uncharacterized protein IL334_003756 [Kwoniella shivajii]|uniref:Major facilitator superfamily (MFS) profile domain-containing protein n=1 Tax=Kwoniella shivajii TaxID=564305 RepID=A0ABZ1CYZ6_9TREE|nr:hypothetical protein IL334_003756 [Kwoniella shivajii]
MLATEKTNLVLEAPGEGQKGLTDVPVLTENEQDDTPSAARYIPMKYRIIAFSLVIFFNTSSSFSESTLSPLKSTFRTELGVTNAQYGAISSASSLVNTILPVLGGLGIDYWGATYAFIMVGAIVSAAGANTTHFGMVVGGRILMGFGSMGKFKLLYIAYESHRIGPAQAILPLVSWQPFGAGHRHRPRLEPSPVGDQIPAFTTVANLIVCILYWYFERRVPQKYRPPLGKNAARKEGALRKVIEFNNLPRLSNLADIQTQTRGTSKLAAGYNSSLQSVVPIVMIPLVGAFIDRFGMRMYFISWTAMMYIVVIGLIGLTKVHPLGPIILGSFALSTYAIPFSASIPVMIGDAQLLGTAIGVWKAFGNGGIIVFDVAAGAIVYIVYSVGR